MFDKRYSLFELELSCETITTNSKFKIESETYKYIKEKLTSNGYKYYRIDTVDQIGFPDILALKKKEYILIEAKILKKKHLKSITDDLEWQFGQVAFAVRAFSMNLNYLIAVGKENNLSLIGREAKACQIAKILRT